MRLKYQVLRVYGSQQRYAPYPQKAPEAGKSVITDFPEPGDESAIIFSSEIPAQISEYVKLYRAYRVFVARKMWRGGEGLPSAVDDAIEHILGENSKWLQEEKYEWYISISVGRKFEIDDALILDSANKYVQLSYEFDESPEVQEFNFRAKEELNSLETYISFLFGSHYFENLIIDQVLILDKFDKFVFLLPIGSGSFSLGIQHTKNVLASSRFDELLEEFKTRRRTASRLKNVIRLRILFIRERDKLKKFFYGFWSLEILIDTISKRARTQTERFVKEKQSSDSYLVSELIKSLDNANIQDRFKVMQCALNYKSSEDLSTFKEVAEKRNNLAHGQSFDAEALPISEVQKLLDKYLVRALEVSELPEIKIAFDT